jgi:Transposase DDE domain
VIYQHPLAYLLGLEGIALLRAFSGAYDREFTLARLREIQTLLDSADEFGDGVEALPITTREGYDQWAPFYNNRVYAECHERGIAPVIPLRKGRIQPETPIKRSTPEWGDLYRRRTAVEREFGRLKHDYGLAFLRVRGLARVRLHADLVMLGRLSVALARARAVSLAA